MSRLVSGCHSSLRRFQLCPYLCAQWREKILHFRLGVTITYCLHHGWQNGEATLQCAEKMSSSAEPDSLESVIDSLKYNDHSRLLERPPDLFWKRGSILQRASPTDGLTLITESDWKFFCQEWDGISAQIEFRNCGTKKVIGSCEEMQISEVDLSPSNDELNNELESREPFIKTDREVCKDCGGEKETHHLLQKLQYCNEEICVHLVHGKEAPKSIVEASGAISEPDRHVSKRSRKTSNGNSINLMVSGSISFIKCVYPGYLERML